MISEKRHLASELQYHLTGTPERVIDEEMAKNRAPVTPAIHALRGAKIPFEEYLYEYQDKGGTAASSQMLGVPEHMVIKTLVMEDERKNPLIVLMHGDSQVSTKNLARHRGCKTVSPCAPQTADRHSGYQVGGTSPFGTRRKMPVYMQQSIVELPEIYINGGGRGFLVKLDPKDAARILEAELVDVKA
jgi:Cys-tRNA(Pro) deacylase